MKRNYEVLLMVNITVAVEGAQDEDEAIELAHDEAGLRRGWDVEAECTALTEPDAWENCRRCADYISEALP